MWVKLDSIGATNSYILHVPGKNSSTSYIGNMYAMYISPDTTLHCIFDDNDITAKIHDTNRNNMAFICYATSLVAHDTTTIYRWRVSNK